MSRVYDNQHTWIEDLGMHGNALPCDLVTGMLIGGCTATGSTSSIMSINRMDFPYPFWLKLYQLVTQK